MKMRRWVPSWFKSDFSKLLKIRKHAELRNLGRLLNLQMIFTFANIDFGDLRMLNLDDLSLMNFGRFLILPK